jgi:tyrosyl-tRNA synthetase
MTKKPEAKIDGILKRGVENVYPSRDFLKKTLESGKKIRIYNGIDPTGPTLHLGHSVVLRKLREFQDLGHEIILLIGDFTGMIGDPTDKSATRIQLTREQVLENCKNYRKQAEKILDFGGANPAKLLFNSEWLSKLTFKEVLEISAYFTVQQMLERDMFSERIKGGKPVGLHEFLYPLMQGYDSVAMDVDMEIGGNDQTFNMLAGRDLLKSMKGKEKFVLTMKLLADPTGKKMGKTEGNMITLVDAPENMFGKVMSWSDEMIEKGFEICTDVPLEEIKEILAMGPRDAKMRLAKEIVAIFHGAEESEKAEAYFVNTFSKKEMPSEIREVSVDKEEISLLDFLVLAETASSKGDARRKIEQGGVELNGEKITDWKAVLATKDSGAVVKVGKIHFVRVLFQ